MKIEDVVELRFPLECHYRVIAEDMESKDRMYAIDQELRLIQGVKMVM